jgi:hypothetical protein
MTLRSDLIDPRTQVQGLIRACCAEVENLQDLQRFSSEHRHGMIVRQCRLCGRKHYELRADPGQFGLRGGGL